MNRVESIDSIVISGDVIKITRGKEIEIMVMSREDKKHLGEFIEVFKLREKVKVI